MDHRTGRTLLVVPIVPSLRPPLTVDRRKLSSSPLKLDLVVGPSVRIPDVRSVSIARELEANKEGLSVDASQNVVETDKEDETVVLPFSNRVDVGGGNFRSRGPVIKREPSRNIFLKGDVSNVDNSPEVARVLGESDAVQEDVGFGRTLTSEVV